MLGRKKLSRASFNSYELISLLLWRWSASCSEVKRVLTVSREVIPTTVTSLVFDAHIACGLRSAVRKAPACTLFNNGGERKHRDGESGSPHATRWVPGGLLFSTAATSETSHPRSLLSVSPGASRTLLKQMKKIPECSRHMRVSCGTLDFAVPIITCTRKTRAASA